MSGEVPRLMCHLALPQYTNSGPASLSTDPITPSTWKGCILNTNLPVIDMTLPMFEPLCFHSLGGHLNHWTMEDPRTPVVRSFILPLAPASALWFSIPSVSQAILTQFGEGQGGERRGSRRHDGNDPRDTCQFPFQSQLATVSVR